ncbi:hypothetical protein CHS0354_027766 [Potamilus streckersoni]|uniref:KY-like immunoglobulin-like domain-containing protein n=1 Tax=Potamilus streckersoni TaxID=2493646 RepID=A0AAE0T3W9_9BIVA|nr:hypothetical protein CHS0354_027766 [Potamilus streckersoni]
MLLENPPKTSSSFSELAEYLTKDFSTDIYKVRAITVWMSAQNFRTRDYGGNIEENTPLAYMKRIRESRGTFAGLFALICRAAKLPCVIIRGVCKTGRYVVGEKDLEDSPSTWNAVYFDGQWNIIHSFFICTPLVNITSDASWRLVYEGNKEPSATYSKKRTFNEFFFCPNPEDFIHFCFPDRLFNDWQLLETKMEINKFLCLPYLRPYFFQFGFKLKNEQTCEIEMEHSVVSIEMEGKKDLLEGLTVSCNVYTQSEGEESASDWAAYIICGRILDSWKVEMRFPVKGVYKCSLYAVHENHSFWLGDFKIMCHSVSQSRGQLPIDPGKVGWGPSQACDEAGLCVPSHKGGIVQVRENEVHVFKFLLMKHIKVKIDLVNDLMSNEVLEKSVEKRYDRKNKELDIIVTIPGRGEYALRLYVMSSTGEFENVCNYLLTDSDTKFPKTKRELSPQEDYSLSCT